jgi:hypothetical protein
LSFALWQPTQYRSTSARSVAAVVVDAAADVVADGGAPACDATTTLVAAKTMVDRLNNLCDMSDTCTEPDPGTLVFYVPTGAQSIKAGRGATVSGDG